MHGEQDGTLCHSADQRTRRALARMALVQYSGRVFRLSDCPTGSSAVPMDVAEMRRATFAKAGPAAEPSRTASALRVEVAASRLRLPCEERTPTRYEG